MQVDVEGEASALWKRKWMVKSARRGGTDGDRGVVSGLCIVGTGHRHNNLSVPGFLAVPGK